jgi:hypothetical protein
MSRYACIVTKWWIIMLNRLPKIVAMMFLWLCGYC